MKQTIMKEMFWLKNHTFKPQNGLGFNKYHNIEPNFEIKSSLIVYHPGTGISWGLKTAKDCSLIKDTMQKYTFIKKSAISAQSLWNFVIIWYSWVSYFDKVS